MVKFFCAIVGVAGSVFEVNISDSESVAAFKDAIKGKNEGIKCPAHNLQLYLARRGKIWLPDNDPVAQCLEEGKDHTEIQALIAGEKMQAMWTIKDVLKEKGMQTLKSKQIHVLVVVPERPPPGGEGDQSIRDDNVRVFQIAAEKLREQVRKQAIALERQAEENRERERQQAVAFERERKHVKELREQVHKQAEENRERERKQAEALERERKHVEELREQVHKQAEENREREREQAEALERERKHVEELHEQVHKQAEENRERERKQAEALERERKHVEELREQVHKEAEEFRERERKRAIEFRERECKQAEEMTKTLEKALNLPTPTKSDSQLGQDNFQQLVANDCVSDAATTVGAEAFWSVEVQAEVDSIQDEYAFVAFITPYFSNVLDSLDVVFVNSERYKSLPQSTLGSNMTYLKPNGFVTHRGMYHKEREPIDGVSREGNSFRFGEAVKALFDCLILFECEITKQLEGAPFGQVVRYIQHLFPKGRGSAVLFNRTTFYLIKSINGSVARVVKAMWVMEGSKALFCDFITKNLSPWVKRLTTACSVLNVEVVEGDSFLGSGAFGRVFKVKQVGQDEDVLALKIVETSSVGLLFQEEDALVHAQPTGLTIRLVEATTEFDEGAAMLLSPVGEPISYPTTSEEVRALFDMLWQLHSAGVTHGDPRVPNVIVKDEQRLWIDLVEFRDVSTLLMQNDAKILTQSILHGVPKDSLDSELMTLIKNYGINPTHPNLDLLAGKVGEKIATS